MDNEMKTVYFFLGAAIGLIVGSLFTVLFTLDTNYRQKNSLCEVFTAMTDDSRIHEYCKKE